MLKSFETLTSMTVILIVFLMCLGLVRGDAHYSHNEYEEVGVYPQKEHSLMKPYQG